LLTLPPPLLKPQLLPTLTFAVAQFVMATALNPGIINNKDKKIFFITAFIAALLLYLKLLAAQSFLGLKPAFFQ